MSTNEFHDLKKLKILTHDNFILTFFDKINLLAINYLRVRTIFSVRLPTRDSRVGERERHFLHVDYPFSCFSTSSFFLSSHIQPTRDRGLPSIRLSSHLLEENIYQVAYNVVALSDNTLFKYLMIHILLCVKVF